MVTLLRIFKLLVVASFFWRKNSSIVFLPSFYALRSKSLASLFSRRKYPNLAELRMEMFVELLVGACKRNMGLEKLKAQRSWVLTTCRPGPMCTCPDGKISPWPWLTLSGFTICSCPLGLGPALSTKPSTSPARPQWPVPAYTTVRLGTAWSRIWLHDLIA